MNSSHRNKDTSPHNHSPKQAPWEFNLKSAFNNKYLNDVNILLTVDTIRFQYKFQINNRPVLIVTIYNRRPKYPRPESMHDMARLFMDFQTLSTVVGIL